MGRRVKKRSQKQGLPPGSLVKVGEENPGTAKITATVYDIQTLEERQLQTAEESFSFRDSQKVAWINFEGLSDVSILEKVGAHFHLHPLVLEDILNSTIRPKTEDHGEYLIVILKMILPAADATRTGVDKFTAEQVAIVLGKNWVLTFQEPHAGDVFDKVRERIRGGKGNLRKLGADYLAYALIDAIVDGYFLVLEELGEEVEDLEEKVTDKSAEISLNEIHAIRKFALAFRRAVWPVRDLLSAVNRDKSPLIADSTHLFFRDIYDHAVEIMDMLEAYREMVAGLMELYLSCISNRMNSIMMVLTVCSVIFMPLTFIAGIYGMNFEYMPELKWKFGYLFALALMAGIAGGMLLFFRRKRWI